MALDCTLPQPTLEGLLRAVASAIPARPGHPVLANVLLTAQEPQEGPAAVSCVGYDLSMGIRASAPALVASGGTVAIPHRMLAALVARLPADEPVRLRVGDDEQLTVEAGEGRYGVTVAHDASDYPGLPVVASEGLALAFGPLRNALQVVAHAASTAEAKPELCGVRFVIGGGELRLEAIHGAGHRAALVRLPDLLAAEEVEAAFTVPTAAVREILRLDLDADDQIVLGQDGGVAVFTAGSTTLICGLLAGDWPSVWSKVPANLKVRLVVNRDELAAAVARAQVVADLTECVVAMDVADGAVTVSAENDLGRTADRVALEHGSSAVTDRLLFRSKYLADALKHTEDPLVAITYQRAGTFAVFEPVGSTLQRYLVMGLAAKQ